MPSGPSNQESEPLLPLHQPTTTSSTPSRSRLSARRYNPPSADSTSKDKGKGRATSLNDLEAGRISPAGDTSDLHSPNAKRKGKAKAKEDKRGRNVTIIFSNESEITGHGNLECWVEDGENVGSLKEQIKTLRPSLQSHNLRLIHSGRLLTDGILLLPWLRSLEERVKRQAAGVGGDVENVLKEVGLTEDRSESSSSDGEDDENDDDGGKRRKKADEKIVNEKVWLHCIVGGKEEKTSTDEEEEVSPSAPRRRGFDVLLDAGLSADDVAAMRRQFYESRGEEVPEGMEDGDINDEHARALEEQWIEGDMTAETATTTTEGLYSSILHGLLTGFLFPITPWFFFREPPLPNFFDADAEAINLSRINQTANRRDSTASISNVNPTDNTHVSTNGESSEPVTTTNASTSIGTDGMASAQDRFMRAGGIGMGLGEIVASQVFGKRMQMGILLGTILNIAFGALRFLN
ncbi:hypothetical protein L486_05928 [Kwoniella mangroviensis CBS 10435]|uniref:Ubiquitin-like domain-containing protein n=1 Tax=Kwoniella mangroviensis CBS 10435 TaxID=1331196 RepID=A0A1B9INB1_9TREE|nr:hypothetical protein L486_05928 [Kwoniella mangroviensis CBS 10435]